MSNDFVKFFVFKKTPNFRIFPNEENNKYYFQNANIWNSPKLIQRQQPSASLSLSSSSMEEQKQQQTPYHRLCPLSKEYWCFYPRGITEGRDTESHEGKHIRPSVEEKKCYIYTREFARKLCCTLFRR